MTRTFSTMTRQLAVMADRLAAGVTINGWSPLHLLEAGLLRAGRPAAILAAAHEGRPRPQDRHQRRELERTAARRRVDQAVLGRVQPDHRLRQVNAGRRPARSRAARGHGQRQDAGKLPQLTDALTGHPGMVVVEVAAALLHRLEQVERAIAEFDDNIAEAIPANLLNTHQMKPRVQAYPRSRSSPSRPIRHGLAPES